MFFYKEISEVQPDWFVSYPISKLDGKLQNVLNSQKSGLRSN